MIGKQFQLMFPDGLRTYKIINVDVSEGWIKLQREGVQGHFYLHESIHKHFLRKIGYRRLNESR